MLNPGMVQAACPHALHTLLSERVRGMIGDPAEANLAQVDFVLTECKHTEKHRGRHTSLDGKASWTGKLGDDEMAFANALRARRRELTCPGS